MAQLRGQEYPLSRIMDIIEAEIEAAEQGITTLVPVIVGDPGIGKSASIKHKAQQMNMDTYIVSLGALPMEWFSGLPEFSEMEVDSSLTHDGSKTAKTTVWTMSDLVRSINTKTEKALSEGKNGLVVLLDDIHLVEPIVQKYLFEFFQNKTLQNYRIHPKAHLVGALNGKDSAGLEGFLSAVINRMAMYHAKFDQEYWYKNIGYSLHPYVASFAQQSSNYKFFLGANETDEASPSPRSWTELSQMIPLLEQKTGGNLELLNGYLQIITSSRVGDEAAIEFMKHVKLFQKFNFEEVLRKKQPALKIKDDINDQILMAYIIRYLQDEKDAEYLVKEILNHNMERRTFLSVFIQEFSTIYANIEKMPEGKGKDALHALGDFLRDEDMTNNDLINLIIEGMIDIGL